MYENVKKEIRSVSVEMLKTGLVSGTAGNVSARAEHYVAITPSAKNYLAMKAEDVMVIDMDGNVVEGTLNPSSEMLMHLEIYRRREDVQAIMHTHSIYASVLAVIHKSLPPIIDELVPKLGGEVRVSKYAMPGTRELANNVTDALEMRSAALIANHGAVTCGKTLKEALDSAILLERVSKIYLLALHHGEPAILPEDVLENETDIWRILHGI